ncbi:MAG: TolC family protein [candidate division Zixibacteria bacterium]
MVLRIIVIISIVMSIGLAYGQENPVTLDFDKALEMALSGNAGLKAKRDAILIEEYRVKEAISAYYPKLSAYSGFSETSLESEIVLPNLFDSLPSNIRLFPQERYNFGLLSKYDLYTFGRRGARKSAAIKGLERAKVDRIEQKNRLFDKTARVFGLTILARDILSIQKKNINRAKRKLDLVEDRIDQGLAAEYDRIKAKLLLSKYRDWESQARAKYDKAKIRLESIIDWNYP